MNRDKAPGILELFFKPGRGALPVLPVLAGCLLLMFWISFGLRLWVYWSGGPGSQTGELLLFLADPLAALLSGGLMVYLIKSNSTNGGHLFGLLAILTGLFFSKLIAGGLPPITPLLIFQIVFTYFMGWFGGSVTSGQFSERLKFGLGPKTPPRQPTKPIAGDYHKGRYYRDLLRRVGWNRETADSLIDYERRRHPRNGLDYWTQAAIERYDLDQNQN